jgi:hypothetical protein
MVRMATKVGAAMGAIAFLVFGLVPGVYFGSYGTLILLRHLFGGPLQATSLVRVATAFGILIGLACVGSVTIIVSAIFGTVIGYAIEALTRASRKEAPSENVTKKS